MDPEPFLADRASALTGSLPGASEEGVGGGGTGRGPKRRHEGSEWAQGNILGQPGPILAVCGEPTLPKGTVTLAAK